MDSLHLKLLPSLSVYVCVRGCMCVCGRNLFVIYLILGLRPNRGLIESSLYYLVFLNLEICQNIEGYEHVTQALFKVLIVLGHFGEFSPLTTHFSFESLMGQNVSGIIKVNIL